MVEFIFTYNEQEIKYTVDLLGRERVFVDNNLVAKPTNWFNSLVSVEIKLGDEVLKLRRYIRSYTDGEYQVTLSNDKKIIDKQTKFAIDLSTPGKETVYQGDEVDWLEEVKLPQGIIHCAWALYFGIILNSFIGEFTDKGVFFELSAWAVAIFTASAVGLFLFWSIKTLSSKPTENEFIQ